MDFFCQESISNINLGQIYATLTVYSFVECQGKFFGRDALPLRLMRQFFGVPTH